MLVKYTLENYEKYVLFIHFHYGINAIHVTKCSPQLDWCVWSSQGAIIYNSLSALHIYVVCD